MKLPRDLLLGQPLLLQSDRKTASEETAFFGPLRRPSGHASRGVSDGLCKWGGLVSKENRL